jgi:predicted aldo/keto reductase-like oxidoreductase
MDTEEQAGIRGYELTAEKNIPLIIMEPVKGGTLAGFADDITAKFHEMDKDASIASFALRWVGTHPNVRVILSGMSTMEQVEDNLKTFESFRPLSEEEKNGIEQIVATLRSRVQNGCTGCRYCMPCPFGVDIPGSFRAWNTYHMYENYNNVKWAWENQIGEEHQPKNCAECGKCEAACPQKISIREDLRKAQADLDRKEMIR